MGDRMDKLEVVMSNALRRIDACFNEPRRIAIVIVAPDDPEHEKSIVFGSLLPSDVRSLAASSLLVSDEEASRG